MNFYLVILLVLVLSLSATIFLFSFQKRAEKSSLSLIFFSIGLFFWTVAYNVFFFSSQPWMMFWLQAAYLFSSLTRLCFFLFSIHYTDNDHWLNKKTLLLFFIEPILTQVFLATNLTHGFFYSRTQLDILNQSIQVGPWFWINAVYNYSLLLVSILFLAQGYFSMSRINRQLLGWLLLGSIAPVILYMANLAGSAIIPGAELSPAIFIIPALILAFGLARFRLLHFSLTNRDSMVEVMKDGWLVLDRNNRVIDMNPVAEQLVNRKRIEVFGQQADLVLSEWPNVVNQIGDKPVYLDTNYSMEMQNDRRYYNLRVQPLQDSHRKLLGHVIFWRDITFQKMAEDSRKLAREEMFLLLRGLAASATEAPNLGGYLADILYQISSAFHCQAIGIYLFDENQQAGETPRLSLASQVGFPENLLKKLDRLLVRSTRTNGMYHQLLVNKQLFFSPEIKDDVLIPTELQVLGPGAMVASPLRATSQTLGIFFIIRKTGSAYSPEEEDRFVAAAEEVSKFIFNDRQRQLAIALTERARLVRDLHDSVTQKLYGLLTLTEAAQAGLEAGNTEMSIRVLTPIAENARQALKEMRLFLYELSPSNLKKDGLVAALNQRFDAVEGRADVKRKIIVDESILLTYEQQVAFFYIAQEALNNTLRHAHARSVLFRMKQNRRNIIMEIEDDGNGFDPQDYRQGGIGLRSMRERSEQIGAILKINSEPKKGTKIIVTLKRDGD